MAKKIKSQLDRFPGASLTIAPTRIESEAMALEYFEQRERSNK
jgi:hypothetical protein